MPRSEARPGVNLAGKNLVGLFWHPSRVVVDIGILRGLPSSLLARGLVEALKAGLVGDPDLFALIEKDGTGCQHGGGGGRVGDGQGAGRRRG